MENTEIEVSNAVDTNESTNTQETVATEKTFTQAELEEIITKRLARETKKIEAEKQKAMEAKLKAELEESEKLAKMSEAERLKALADKERKQFESERKKFEEEMRAYNAEKMLNITMQTLSEKGLPVEFAGFIKAENAEDIMENINNFENGFKDAVDKAVNERLRGTTPKSGSSSSKAFSYDQLKGMSTQEINANWDKIKKTMNK